MRVQLKEEPPRCVHKGGVLVEVPLPSSLAYQMLTILWTQGLWYKDTFSHAHRGVKLCLRPFGGLIVGVHYEQVNEGFRGWELAFLGYFRHFWKTVGKGGDFAFCQNSHYSQVKRRSATSGRPAHTAPNRAGCAVAQSWLLGAWRGG